MKGNHTTNMTQGSPSRLLIRFAFSMLLGNLFQQAYNMADSMIVGRYLGSSALAAVGATGSIGFLFFSICNGIGAGCGVATSHAYGAGNFRYTQRTIANAALIMLFFPLVVAIAAYFCAPLVLNVLGTPENILADAITYMQMTCIGVPLVAVYNYSSSMLRALGDSRTPLYFLIFASLLNVVLDLFCVCVLKLGVFGAALATVIAQVTAGIGCLLYAIKSNPYFRLSREDFRPDREIIGKAVRIGLPMALQWSLIAISATGLQAFINSFGATAVAAFTAVSRLEQLAHMPYGSVNAALSTYTGQNYGAGNTKRVRAGLKHGMLLSTVFTAILMIVCALFDEQLVGLFVKESDVVAIGAKGLRLISLFFIWLAVIYMCRAVLNGIGDAMFALINGGVEVVARIGFPILAMRIPGMGMDAMWWATGVTWLFSALFCWLRYHSWSRKAELQTEKMS